MMEFKQSLETQNIEAIIQEALDEGCDAVVYNQLHKRWSTGSMTEIPERFRNGEVSYYHHSIYFNPGLGVGSMDRVISGRQHLIPIAPEDCLFLQIHCAGDHLRFSRSFATTWEKIPNAAKLFLKTYWESDFIHHVGGPDIKYVDWKSMVKGRTTAWIYQSGHEIVFRGFIVDRMPDAVVESLVFHELATVHTVAAVRANGRGIASICESDIEETLLEWSLEPYVYMSWEDDHKKQIKKWEKENDGRPAVRDLWR